MQEISKENARYAYFMLIAWESDFDLIAGGNQFRVENKSASTQ